MRTFRDGFVVSCCVLWFAAPVHAGTVRFATYLGGVSADLVGGVAVDPAGNLLVVGRTTSANFPIANAFDGTLSGGDAFLARFSSDGSTLLQSTFFGGSGDEEATDVAVDGAGRIWIAGVTSSTDLPLAGAFQASLGGRVDAFISRFSMDALTLEYSSYLGGADAETDVQLALDPTGNAYLMASTGSSDVPLMNPLQGVFAGGVHDFLVSKIDGVTGARVYTTYLGGSGDDHARGIVAGSSGEAIVAGASSSANFPVAFPRQGSRIGAEDAVLVRLAADGQSLVFSTYLGGSGTDGAGDVTVDDAGNIWMVGSTGSADFPLDKPLQSALVALTDGFVSRFTPDGQSLTFSTFVGGSSWDTLTRVAPDSQGRIVAGGSSTSLDFPIVAPVQSTLFSAGTSDDVVLRIRTDVLALDFSSYYGGSNYDALKSLVVLPGDDVLLGGETESAPWAVVNAFQPIKGGGITDGCFYRLGLCSVPVARISRLLLTKTSFPEIELTWEEPADPDVTEYHVYTGVELRVPPVDRIAVVGRGTAILRTTTAPEPIATYRVATASSCGSAPF